MILCKTKVIVSVETFSRELKTELLCSSPDLKQPINIAHTQAKSGTDTLHYLISSVGVPSILVARTYLNTTLRVNCSHLVEAPPEGLYGAIEFSNQPYYVYSLLIYRVFEYNDVEDTGNLKEASKVDGTEWHVYPLNTLQWEDFNINSNVNASTIVLRVSRDDAQRNLTFQNNGSLSIDMQIYGHEDRTKELPCLMHTINTTLFSFTIDNLEPHYERSRYALEMILVTSNPTGHAGNIWETRSIDDEHTPGIFKMVDWLSSISQIPEDESAYLQWKPVTYKKSARSLSVATKAIHYDPQPGNASDVGTHKSLALAYFGELSPSIVSMTVTNVSFGLSKDKFYSSTNYSSWTASLGYGHPPADTISTMLIIVLAVGLGIPVVLIILGGIGVCYKRRRDSLLGYTNLSSYEAIN